MRPKNLDLIVAVLIAAMNLLQVLLPYHLSIIEILLVLPLVFILPGYTLTEVLFYRQSLSGSHRLLLSLGISLAIDIVCGIILNLTPVGLQAVSWAVVLGLLTLLFSLLLAFLRRGASEHASQPAQPIRFRFSIYDLVLLSLATTIVLLAIRYAAIGVAQQPYQGFTQFWMLPIVQTGKSCAVRLGVHNFEATPVTYHISVTMNGVQVDTPPSIVLTPQNEWLQVVPIAAVTANNIYVEAKLYRLDKPQSIYQEVNVTIPNSTASSDGKMRICGKPQVAPGAYPVNHPIQIITAILE